MLALLTATQNFAFTIALGLMVVIAVMEGAASLMGAGLSQFIDAMLPDMDVDLQVDAGASEAAPSALTRLLGWMHVGRVPALVLLVVFLTAFGLIGLGMQSMVHGALGTYLPGWLAALPALVLSLPAVRFVGGLLGYILPDDETDAVAESSFIGRTAVITLGTARHGSPAEAKLRDEHGHTHYVMVQPDTAGASFNQGAAVRLTDRHGAVFIATATDSDARTG
ncbi:MAG: YqiJ family protein [Gammaproteobacteria bacterium]|nr:YqiJ family protein [Gammaproteobacteria bacterium]